MKLKSILVGALLSLTFSAFAQQSSPWNKFEWLTGEWIGEGSGKPGQGGGTFSFKLDLGEKIMIRKSHSEYPATDKKPKIVHDDLMVIYLDYSGTPSKAIYFDNEGHTINYSISYTDKSIVFTSAKIANIPIFRLTYLLLDHENIDIKFEMSQDGLQFMTYIGGKSSRVRSND